MAGAAIVRRGTRRGVSTVPANPLAGALASGPFAYVVELVASALTREAQLARRRLRGWPACPTVVAGSVTSYAGGSLGHDPLRVGTAAARARPDRRTSI